MVKLTFNQWINNGEMNREIDKKGELGAALMLIWKAKQITKVNKSEFIRIEKSMVPNTIKYKDIERLCEIAYVIYHLDKFTNDLDKFDEMLAEVHKTNNTNNK